MDDLQRQMDQIEKRTRRYWFDDGLAEIVTGGCFLLVALYFLVAQAVEARPYGRLVNLVFPVLVVLVAFAGRRATRIAKDRFVHPRTGYVSFERAQTHRWANALLSFVIAALLAALATRAEVLHDWIPALIGLTLAVAFLLVGRKAAVLRFPAAGLSCVVVGVLLSVLRLNENLAGAALFAWLGLVLIAGGTVALAGYMRRVPPREEA